MSFKQLSLTRMLFLTDGTVDNCATEQVRPTAAGFPAAGRQGLWYTARRSKG